MSQHPLSASQILKAEDLKTHDELVPEWPNEDGSPGLVHLVEMGALESIDMSKQMAAHPGDGMFIILINTIRNLDGSKVFTVEDIPALKLKNFKVLDRLQRIALRLNGSGKEAEVTLKKDLSETASAVSPSDLQPSSASST